MVKGPTPDKARQGVPDRWLYCPKIGETIMNTFIPFKTPLCHLYDDQIPQKKLRFHPKDIFTHVERFGGKLGLWIDLTNTDRYYFVEEVQECGAVYKKLMLSGHDGSPSEEDTERFTNIVRDFRDNHPNDLIGVHCTHGFNRTGFLIAAYLFNVEGWAIDAAISEFASNRHGGIYKQEYINDLFDRYAEEDDDRIVAPPRPMWGEADMNSNGRPTNGMNGSDASTSKQGPNSNGKQFMDGLVDGVTLCDDEEKKIMLRAKIKKLCNHKNDNFPGLQPVSLSHQNLELIARERYMVSWKADGMRYMVFIFDRNEVYAFDRDNEVFHIKNLDFVNRRGEHIRNTLVDAEMVIDKVEENGKMVDYKRLLIYDIISYENDNIASQNFKVRVDCIVNKIIKPRTDAIMKGLINRAKQPMSVRHKQFWELVAVPKLFHESFTKNLRHEIDGLIFQPVDKPYTSGRCDSVLKWKPPSHNSVDFRLQITKISKPGMLPEWIGKLLVISSNRLVEFGAMKATNSLKKYDGKIIECTMELDSKGKMLGWKFMRERTDKSAPNAFHTASNVFETMQHPITKEYLCEFVQRTQYQRHHEPLVKRPRCE